VEKIHPGFWYDDGVVAWKQNGSIIQESLAEMYADEKGVVFCDQAGWEEHIIMTGKDPELLEHIANHGVDPRNCYQARMRRWRDFPDHAPEWIYSWNARHESIQTISKGIHFAGPALLSCRFHSPKWASTWILNVGAGDEDMKHVVGVHMELWRQRFSHSNYRRYLKQASNLSVEWHAQTMLIDLPPETSQIPTKEILALLKPLWTIMDHLDEPAGHEPSRDKYRELHLDLLYVAWLRDGDHRAIARCIQACQNNPSGLYALLHINPRIDSPAIRREWKKVYQTVRDPILRSLVGKRQVVEKANEPDMLAMIFSPGNDLSTRREGIEIFCQASKDEDFYFRNDTCTLLGLAAITWPDAFSPMTAAV